MLNAVFQPRDSDASARPIRRDVRLIPVSALAVVERHNYDRQHSDFSPGDRAIDV